MNKIIDGKMYNTETAKYLASAYSGHNMNDFDYWEENLYRTKSGNFFLHGLGGPRSRYGEWHGNNGCGSEQIIPMEYDEAVEWAEINLDGEEVENIFGILQEDKYKLTVDITESSKAKLDELKKETGKSASDIIENLIRQM